MDLTFGADYTCRPEQVKAALHNAVSLVSGILPEPAPFVRVSGYGESNIEYTVRVWCKRPTTGPYIMTSWSRRRGV